MKKIFYFVLATPLLFSHCTKDDNAAEPTVCPEPATEIITFESADRMSDFRGNAVVPADVTLVGGVSGGTYNNIFCGLSYADEQGVMGLTCDKLLFSNAIGTIWFGSYYCDGTGFGGGRLDMWSGFVPSKNCNATATKMEYKDQFSVWAEAGADGSETFAACYDGTMFGGDYSASTIVLTKPRIVESICLANSTMTATYKSSKSDYVFSVKITGIFDGETTGDVTCQLVAGDTPVEGWTKVDLQKLGKVDNLKMTVVSNDYSAPMYFCVDNIVVKNK